MANGACRLPDVCLAPACQPSPHRRCTRATPPARRSRRVCWAGEQAGRPPGSACVPELLNDPLYLGNRHARARGAAYDAFIEKYLATASSMFPNALLHFEDFGPGNARRTLVTYGDRYRIFNDDMQGTGAITLAAALSAVKVTGVPMRQQKLLVFGAGTAGEASPTRSMTPWSVTGPPPSRPPPRCGWWTSKGCSFSDMTALARRL
jgi:malate dehydrogenase (oxaloacetate-decarboxylating)